MDLSRIENLVRPVVESIGLRLYDLEFHGKTLRVSIHNPSGAVGISDCERISRLLDPLLDVEEAVAGASSYELEVSTPGLNRQLRTLEHFVGAVGEEISLTTESELNTWNPSEEGFFKRKHLRGKVDSVSGNIIHLEAEGRKVQVPVEAVKRARVEFEFKGQPKKGKKE